MIRMPIIERDVDGDPPRLAARFFVWEPTEEHRQRVRRVHGGGVTPESLRDGGGLMWTQLYFILTGDEVYFGQHNWSNTRLAEIELTRQWPGALQ